MIAGVLRLNPQDEGNEIKLLNDFIDGDKGDITPGRDIIVRVIERDQANANPRIVGLLCARNMFLVHELRIDPSHVLKRVIAEDMLNYALALGKTMQTGPFPNEAIFITKSDNEALIRFLREHRATEQDDGKLFTLEIQ
jgi:hypothetical protein